MGKQAWRRKEAFAKVIGHCRTQGPPDITPMVPKLCLALEALVPLLVFLLLSEVLFLPVNESGNLKVLINYSSLSHISSE